GRGFLPAPGTLTAWRPPSGPGVRVDEGYLSGMTVPGAFDSLVAKLVVTGADRDQALERARRALGELVVDGMPTVVPFHRAVVDDPAFTADAGGFAVHTRWIETEFTNEIPPYGDESVEAPEPVERRTVTVEVNGKRLDVTLPADLAVGNSRGGRRRPVRRRASSGAAAAGGDAISSPMQGTIVKVTVADGDTVAEGDTVVVLEAMKMEQPLTAHRAGVVSGLSAAVGETVGSGAVICEVVDAG